ncbi:MAG: ankyrin repeat domain-containing protein [Sphingobium sp.]
MKSVAAQIIDAISDENVLSIELLFSRNPELLNQHTMMAGQTWLGHAASSGKLLAVKKLIELGADPNIGDRWDGSKSLCSAGHSGNPEIVRCLLEHGAEIDTDASVRNPLFASIVGRSPECVRVILSAGIDAAVRYNSATMDDMDAMAFALMRGERECAEIIAQSNAKGDEAAAAKALAGADEIAERNAHAERPCP